MTKEKIVSVVESKNPDTFEKIFVSEQCEDTISRTELLKHQYRIDDSATLSVRDVVNVEDIEDAPSVLPRAKIGYWTPYFEDFNALGFPCEGGSMCSVCGYKTHNKLHLEIGCPHKFCPNCGSMMEEK